VSLHLTASIAVLGNYVEVAIGRFARLLHYQMPAALNIKSLQPGCRLLVPFGSQVAIGYFIRYVDQPAVTETKAVLEILDGVSPFPPALIKLLQWISEYYSASMGATLQCAFPKQSQHKIDRLFELTQAGKVAMETGKIKSDVEEQMVLLLLKGERTEALLRTKIGAKYFTTVVSSLKRKTWIKQGFAVHVARPRQRKQPSVNEEVPFLRDEPHRLNPDQQAAYDQIGEAVAAHRFSPFLLQGVTGSGKTEVYLRVIEKALLENRGAIVLVPEIGLTPQLAARFCNRFGKTIALLHSGLSPSERQVAWRRIKEGEARVAIGARSALFAPMEDIGVIIVDEEHDPSYKQEEGVRYHARDAALVYGKQINAAVVLGSATPSAESLYNVSLGKYKAVLLPRRVSARPLPAIQIVDLRPREEWVRPFLTRPLILAIEKRLICKEQVILFVNRRGHCPSLLCHDCGHQWHCKNCSVSLAFHKRRKKLLCHYCGYFIPPPALCPDCQGTRLLYLGIGTEQVEEAIKALFPTARVLRMDRDTTSQKASQSKMVSAMEEREADILIGTQMVAKGHDFPNVTLVGVICADLSLSFPDFRASERTFQLLAQVAGRAGRGDTAGEVLIQTFQPEQPIFHILPDCAAFYDMEQVFRKELDFPPFSRLILLQLCHRDEATASRQAELLVGQMKDVKGVSVLGPAPAPLARLRKDYRYHILLKGKNPTELRAVLNKGLHYVQTTNPKGIRLIVDVDPQNVI
jgi:primosomal protein N' (replication factor Y)